MFKINEDNSIYITRGDMAYIKITCEKNGKPYTFQAGDVVRFNVCEKKNCDNVVLQKDFPVTATASAVDIILDSEDTKIGGIISKPADYWYEVVLNPFDNPHTIIAYDDEGTRVFKLFPEANDKPQPAPKPEAIKVIDTELDMTSERPVQNQVIARAFANLQEGYQKTHEAVSKLHVTPQMFGAVGDGVADDTEAIQMAIDFLYGRGGGVLTVPTGSYNVSRGNIVVKSNVKIVGVGSPRLISNSKSGYFSIFTNDKVSLENVEISGLTVDQWGELDVQPDNNSIPCCCVAFLGKCENITVKDNLFYSVGGWTICITDTKDNYGSSRAYIANNRINWKQAGDGTWYDASAIYAETDNHIIEHNYIKSFVGERAENSRWKSEGGIETHGVGAVKWNEIHDVQAGINIVEHAYDRTTKLGAKREIAFNVMRGVCRGLWFWIPQKPYGMENFEIYSNDIEVVAEGYYAGYGAVCCTLSEKNYDDTANYYNGYIKGVKIYNNKFHFVDNSYTGNEYFDLKNVGGISLSTGGTVENVEIYGNEINNFPWGAIVTYQWDSNASRYHKGFNIYHNTICDCGYGMPNEYQRCVFTMYHVDNVNIHHNTVKWKNQNGTKYLIGGFGQEVMQFVNNEQLSENGFTVYGSSVDSSISSKAGVFIDTKGLGYREYSGNPNGTLTPKKIGERVYDATYKRWYVSVGNTNASWRLEASKERGVATIEASKNTVKVNHSLAYLPTNILITPLGYLGNVYVSFVSTNYFDITCTEAPTSAVKVCWEAEI